MRALPRLVAPALVAAAACTHGTLTLGFGQAPGARVEHVSATAQLAAATLSWSSVAGATAYDVYLSKNSALTPANADRSVAGAVSPLVVASLDVGPWYAIVSAVGTSGERAPSSAVRIDPLPVGNGGVVPTLLPVWSKDFTPAARFGGTLLGAGDTNHDGFGDVLIGAYQWSSGQSQEGGLFLFRGTATGLASTYAWHDECDQTNAACGTGVVAADFNGDGEVDVVNGGAQYKSNFTDEGATALFLGTPAGPSLIVSGGYFGEQLSANLGRHLGNVGDVNGDGKADILVAAHNHDGTQTDEGEVRLFLGTASGLSISPAWTADGGIAGARFGWNVSSSPGDVNGDRLADLAIGGHRTSSPESEEGRVSFFPGSVSGPPASPTWTWEPDEAQARFGNSIAFADVNGDGFSDLVAGAPGHANGAGRAYVFFGSPAGLPSTPSWTFDGASAGNALGESVALAGDVNGDGFDDVLVGEPGFDGAGCIDCGRALLFLGGPLGLAPTPAWMREGNAAGERLGGTVAGAKDVNGDGSDDLLLGIESQTEIAAPIGRVELFFGPPRNGPGVDAGAPFDGNAGVSVTLAATYSTSGAFSPHACAVDWGDGTPSTSIDPCSPAQLGAASHTFSSAGDPVVHVRVTNGFGLAGESFTTAHVH